MKMKKTIILYKIIHICFVFIVAYSFVYTINTAITGRDYIHLLHYSFYNVKDTMMEPKLNKNDFLIIKDVSQNEIQIGDILFYNLNNNMNIDRLVSIKQDNGTTLYITKGENNYYPNIEEIDYSQIRGVVIINIPLLGFFTRILEYKVVTFAIFIILIGIYVYKDYINKNKLKRKRKKIKEKEEFYQTK